MMRKWKGSSICTDQRNRQLYIMLIPAIVLLFLFHYVPMFGILIAFEDYSPRLGIFNSKWVGLEHFRVLFSTNQFFPLLKNVLRISTYSLLFCFPFAILLALLINEVRNRKFKKAVQTISIMPYFISTLVVCGMVKGLLSSEGVLNVLRISLGKKPIMYLSEAKLFPSIIVLLNAWQTVGWNALIYSAAINAIDDRLYEAARLDGCNRLQLALHITLPGLLPTVIVLLLLDLGSLFTVSSDIILLLYSPLTYETADVFGTFIFRNGVRGGSYGFSAAAGVLESVLNFGILVLFNRISKKVNGKSLW